MNNELKTVIKENLAIHYHEGVKNKTIFLMPYPHASAVKPIIKSELGKCFIQMGYNVISFDPPGLFQSTRNAEISIKEMIGCAIESLNTMIKKGEKIILVGHSMGGFCCFPLIHQYPKKFEKIILIGTLPGFSAIRKHKGLPFKFRYYNRKFWQVIYFGLRLMYFRGNLEIYKKLENIYKYESWVDKSRVILESIEKDDKNKKPPIRSNWSKIVRKFEFYSYLPNVRQDTLILVGLCDPQTPLGCSKEIHDMIPHSKLKVFQKSGHYPFVEEKKRFQKEIKYFL